MAGTRTLHIGAHQVILTDTVTTIGPDAAGKIIVTGSHGGLSAAAYAARVQALLYVFNDAGLGKDCAGIAGLARLETAAIAACAVAHTSARIGEAHDTLESGVISHLNDKARALGLVAGQSIRAAIAGLRQVKPVH